MSLGGEPVLIHLELEDCDMVAEKMVAEKPRSSYRSRTALTEGAKVVSRAL
jgi:hypothetical protein